MKKQLQLLTALILASVSSFGQTNLFFDNFDPVIFPASITSNKGFTALTPTSSVSDAIADYTGYNSSTDGFYLASSNGTSGLNCIWNATSSTFTTNLSVQSSSAATFKGTSTIAVPLSKISAPFTPILGNNTDVITWSFGMRINKSTQLTPFSLAFNPGLGICGGMILATNASNNLPIAATDSPANGYAVIFSGSETSSTANRVDFGSFTGGLSYSPASTSSTFSSLLTVDNIAIGGNAISVIVTYKPSTNTWTLKVRQDGSSSIVDPDTATANAYVTSIPSSAIDNLYTGTSMTNMMLFYNHNSTNGIYIDNLKVKTDVNLGTTKYEISGLNVYPNPVTKGMVFINSAKSENKKVAIYDVLGKQLIEKEISNGALDVSSLNKGVYILKVTEGAAFSTRKLIIE